LEQVRQELDDYSDFDLHQLCVAFPEQLGQYELDEECLYDSPKVQKLREMLPALAKEGHHTLLFSQWTRILDLLEVLAQTLGIPYLRLDGSTPVRARQHLINTFNAGEHPLFLLSTKAGGLGINLTRADVVIMHDLDFNPETDRQAIDRCHRFGQTREVTVYKLVVKETVDEGKKRTCIFSLRISYHTH